MCNEYKPFESVVNYSSKHLLTHSESEKKVSCHSKAKTTIKKEHAFNFLKWHRLDVKSQAIARKFSLDNNAVAWASISRNANGFAQ